MLRRVLKHKQADRLLWATLLLLTLLGVAIAIKLSLKAEEKTRWVGGVPPATELEENPLAAHSDHADSDSVQPGDSLPVTAAPPESLVESVPAKPPAAPPAAETVPRGLAVQQLTTPLELHVAPITSACRTAIEGRGPWLDRRTARPWPECLDDRGNAMVAQLCTYVRLATGEWVLSDNSRTVPRCQAELPLVRTGKIRSTGGR
jgi:hypothetical protein